MPPRKDEPSPKRRKLDSREELLASEHYNQDAQVPHKGLDRPISPPVSRRKNAAVQNTVIVPTWDFGNVPQPSSTPDMPSKRSQERDGGRNYMPSPIQLTHIEDLAPHQNMDAVKLKDIIGDPMIKECWNFNFLFDIDFVM
jgi:tyrosyl-DNA phosphodiesterase-1